MQRVDHIRLMASYNAWMNDKLYEAAQCLSHEALVADKGAFFGSILGTLNHIIVGDTIWLQRFAMHPAHYAALDALSTSPSPQTLNQITFTDLESCSVRRKMLDDVILRWADTIKPMDLDVTLAYVNMKGLPQHKNMFSLLMHFFNHQTHHRGQVSTLLSQRGIELYDTDLVLLTPEQPIV